VWFLNLIRWKNLLIIMVMQACVLAFICAHEVSPEPLFSTLDTYYFHSLIALLAATVPIAAAGNIINDIYDRRIDAVNKPDRNAVGAHISLKNAWRLWTLLNGAGIIAGYILSPPLGLINLGVAILLWLYSFRLKCIPVLGNLVVAFCMGLSVWVTSFAQDYCDLFGLFIYSFFAALTGLIREMVKDLEDIEGDSVNKCNTLPVAVGRSFAKNLTAATQFFATLAIAAESYMMVRLFPDWHLYYFGFAVVLPMLILFVAITLAKTKKDYSRISTGLKLVMLLGLAYLPIAYYFAL
jgi:4-hydroxybenzoate polyprenyltransferase